MPVIHMKTNGYTKSFLQTNHVFIPIVRTDFITVRSERCGDRFSVRAFLRHPIHHPKGNILHPHGCVFIVNIPLCPITFLQHKFSVNFRCIKPITGKTLPNHFAGYMIGILRFAPIFSKGAARKLDTSRLRRCRLKLLFAALRIVNAIINSLFLHIIGRI